MPQTLLLYDFFRHVVDYVLMDIFDMYEIFPNGKFGVVFALGSCAPPSERAATGGSLLLEDLVQSCVRGKGGK